MMGFMAVYKAVCRLFRAAQHCLSAMAPAWQLKLLRQAAACWCTVDAGEPGRQAEVPIAMRQLHTPFEPFRCVCPQLQRALWMLAFRLTSYCPL